MAIFQSAVTIVLFLFILGALVVIHEIGHFVTARLAGVRVLEFGIGFPPRARVVRASGETLYTLNWLPIGGFVKLEGEDGDDGDDPRSFVNARLPIKLVILVAGVVMNVLLAFVIFTGIAFFGDPSIGVRAGQVQPDSPAAQAGIESGDVIVSVDGRAFSINGTETVLSALQENAGRIVTIGVQRPDGSVRDVTTTLRSRADVLQGRGALGIQELSLRTGPASFPHPLPEAIAIGAQRTTDALGLIVDGLGRLAESIRTDPTQPPPAAGPVGIASQIGTVFWELGPVVTLSVAAILSANLAVVNILPFPPLDGGRMLVIVLKAIFGQRISVRAERLTYFIGFVMLFAFLIWITGFDIIRGLNGGL